HDPPQPNHACKSIISLSVLSHDFGKCRDEDSIGFAIVHGRIQSPMDNSHNASAPGIADLPDSVRHRLSDDAFVTDETAIGLLISTADGWPAVAHLSVGELLLGSDGLVRMAVWRESRTCAALAEQRRGALLFSGPDQLLEIRVCLLAQAPLETSKA